MLLFDVLSSQMDVDSSRITCCQTAVCPIQAGWEVRKAERGTYLSSPQSNSPNNRCGTNDAGMSLGLTFRPASPHPTTGKKTTRIASQSTPASANAVLMSRRGKYRTKIADQNATYAV